MDLVSRRRELKAFLRARRNAVAPEAVGLPHGPRRLAPGLRREEVAAIAGVGLTWYTWLEQGRDINPSALTLRSVAKALRLSAADEAYLFALAGLPQPRIDAQDFQLSPAMASVMEAYAGPVTVLSPLFDLLAANDLADRLYEFDRSVDPFPSNQIWQFFLNANRRALYEDHDGDGRNFVGLFRMTSRSVVGTERYEELVRALSDASPEFASTWSAREIAPVAPRAVRLKHRTHGRLAVNSLRLPIEDGRGAMIVFLGPADDSTAATFRAMRRQT